MNDEGLNGLLNDKFELGGEASVAGGHVGREYGAATDALMQAAILSYSHSRGLFAGVNLKGVVVQPEDDLNQAVYHKSARELLGDEVTDVTDPITGLHVFPQTVGRHTVSPTVDR